MVSKVFVSSVRFWPDPNSFFAASWWNRSDYCLVQEINRWLNFIWVRVVWVRWFTDVGSSLMHWVSQFYFIHTTWSFDCILNIKTTWLSLRHCSARFMFNGIDQESVLLRLDNETLLAWWRSTAIKRNFLAGSQKLRVQLVVCCQRSCVQISISHRPEQRVCMLGVYALHSGTVHVDSKTRLAPGTVGTWV